ncbi:MAG: MATE family efflux transporter [Betaproteobacteria bacterium]
MSTNRHTDFTAGSIPKHLIRFSIPMFLGNLLQALYNTVDSFWVGRFLGPNALAAVSIGFPIILALVAVVMGLTMATTVMVSQYYGARQTEMVKRTVGNTIVLLVAASLLLSALGLAVVRPLLGLISTPPELMADALSYLRIFITGLVFMFLYNALSAILRGLGDSRTPLRFLFYATVINIILDPLMIFGVWPFPRMGVAGAALATVLAQAISVLLLFHYLSRTNHLLPTAPAQWRFDAALTRTMFRIGLPSGAQQLVVSMGGLVLTSIINAFGSTIVAAYGAASRLDQFAFMPSMSTSLAVSSLVGQNIGAGKFDRVRQVVRWGTLISAGITAALSALAVFAPQPLLSLFTTDQAVLAAGATYLRIVGLSYIPFAVMLAINGALRGAGDSLPTMLNTIGSLWLIRVPLAKVLSAVPSLGPTGIWVAVAASPVAGLLLSYGYYLTGRWKTKSVVQPLLEEGEF